MLPRLLENKMATCNVQQLVSQSNCFNCLYDTRQMQMVQVALLCQILQASNPMASCDVNTLMQSAQCFDCLSDTQLMLVQAQLLCEILAAGGTGGGGGGNVLCGAADPVAPPTGACAMYYRTDTGSIWIWDGAAWILRIV